MTFSYIMKQAGTSAGLVPRISSEPTTISDNSLIIK